MEDLAARYPERLKELVELWDSEAERHQVFPLDDRNLERMPFSYFLEPRNSWVFEQGMARVSGYAAPTISDRSYRIIADIEIAAGTQGVILSVGGCAGGYVMFVDQGRLVHEYIGPKRRWTVESLDTLPLGRHELRFDFRKTGRCMGIATLLVDGSEIGRIQMEDTWPFGPTAGGVCCGYDDASPLSDRYAQPFTFTGRIHRVTVVIDDDYCADPALANHIALSED